MKLAWISMLVVSLLFASGCRAQQEMKGMESRSAGEKHCRLFEDPSTHVQWILFADTNHPAHPAHLKPATDGGSCSAGNAVMGRSSHPEGLSRPPAIHASDELVIAQHTPAADVRLEATALAAATVGQILRVRLRGSGRMVAVRIDGPGRATLVPDSEVRW
jgi:hypothetical protein